MTDIDLGTTDEEEVEEVDDTVEEFDSAYYGIRVNGKIVWQSEGEPMLIDRVVVSSARGEVTAIGSPGNDAWLDITVNERSYDAPETYLDMIEAEKAQERRDRFEPESSTEQREGYVEADPETGAPVEVQSQEEQNNEKAMAGDIEF